MVLAKICLLWCGGRLAEQLGDAKGKRTWSANGSAEDRKTHNIFDKRLLRRWSAAGIETVGVVFEQHAWGFHNERSVTVSTLWGKYDT